MKKNNNIQLETLQNTLGFEIDESKYKTLFRRQLLRLILTYLLPLFLLILFFQVEYNKISREQLYLHLKSIAETQAQTLDLFLRERVVNLKNVIETPAFLKNTIELDIENFLARLQKDSEAFIDLGVFDSTGIQKLYSGPFSNLRNIDYSNEI
ncbi:MAG: hypothetical protein ACK42Z_04720 [Candidatus Kapaibacteriota bacterium]